MKLYHYTSVPLAGVIFNTELKGSPYRTQDGRTVGPCVWLTTSPSPLGHGLLTGEKLTPSNVEYLKRIGRPPKNLTTHKKRWCAFRSNLSRYLNGHLKALLLLV
ncbi:hypothetical protein ALP29_201218 [Pseudomonas syringae pv. avii]|uniref:Uncharacterized protein n=1 Tax=Pseudomonas syringae pv. avii TaxID=663959 RepID=A0A3M5W0R6_PSESX|nr:hypothetical protein ALP29_201218 [Pseudomonas syringae pv. avii]